MPQKSPLGHGGAHPAPRKQIVEEVAIRAAADGKEEDSEGPCERDSGERLRLRVPVPDYKDEKDLETQANCRFIRFPVRFIQG